jgi:hypothetical protein
MGEPGVWVFRLFPFRLLFFNFLTGEILTCLRTIMDQWTDVIYFPNGLFHFLVLLSPVLTLTFSGLAALGFGGGEEWLLDSGTDPHIPSDMSDGSTSGSTYGGHWFSHAVSY